jgi:hypothetical protein
MFTGRASTVASVNGWALSIDYGESNTSLVSSTSKQLHNVHWIRFLSWNKYPLHIFTSWYFTFASVRKALGSIPTNHSSSYLSMISSLLQWLPMGLRIVLSEHFLVAETEKAGSTRDAPKPSHCAWQRCILTTNDRCAGALSYKRNQLFLANHENVYATRKPAFLSMPPYHKLLRAIVTSLKKIRVAKYKTICSRFVLQSIFSTATNKHYAGTNSRHLITTRPNMTELIAVFNYILRMCWITIFVFQQVVGESRGDSRSNFQEEIENVSQARLPITLLGTYK